MTCHNPRDVSSMRAVQLAGVDQVISNSGYMLGFNMGVGKTITALTGARILLDCFLVRHTLVVAPLLVAEETWPNEIEAWTHTRFLTYEVLTGPAERREQRARRLPEITIVNTENLVWLIEFWGDDWPYDMVIIDEISRFKNPEKKTKPTKVAVQRIIDETLAGLPKGMSEPEIEKAVAKAVKKAPRNDTRFGALCKVRKHIDYIVGLTGTPAPNGLIDLWAQYYLLDQGDRLYGKFTQFRSRWFESDYMGFKYAPRPGSFEQIVERVKDITMSVRTEDCIDMPPLVHNVIEVKLPEKVMKQYRKFEKTLMLEEHDIEAVNNGVLTGKLLQLASGAVYDEEGVPIFIHDLKLQALDSVIEEAAGKPVLVAYNYQFDLERLRKRYPKAEVAGETKNLEKRWNAGEIPILLAHPQSAGHGLNLQYGGHISVWYSVTWSLEYYQQLNKRLHRPGQQNTVFVHHLVATGTMDERVMQVLPQKDATQSAIIDATCHKIGHS